jgi:hypothetical protein
MSRLDALRLVDECSRFIHPPGARFADSAAGRRLATYTSLYGLGLVIRRSEGQTLPGSGEPTLRLATAAKAPS